jgi:hypothetical protein
MKNIAICSLMRAGSNYEQAYYLLILALSRRTFNIQSVNVVYDTEPTESEWLRKLLRSHSIPVYYEIGTHSSRDFDRLEDRARQWAAIGNQCLELALSRGDNLTHLAWIEADLSYPHDTMEILLARNKPIIAPLVYLNNVFYDSWGFRDKNGARVSSFPAVNPIRPRAPIEMTSVGSFVVFDMAVFRSDIRFRGDFEHGLLVGICEDAAKAGLKAFVDPTISVLHPVSSWREQVWHFKTMQVFVDNKLKSDKPIPAGKIFAGPFEEMVRPYLDKVLRSTYGALGTGRVSVKRNPEEKTFDIRVDFDSKQS